MTTIREWLNETFGNTAEQIDGLDAWGNAKFYGVNLTLNGSGGIATSCGGRCIMTFPQPAGTSGVYYRPLYLVYDTTAGEAWSRSQSEIRLKASNDRASMTPDDWKVYHAYKPHDRLRLTQSA